VAVVKKYFSRVTRVENPLPDIYTVYFESTEKHFKYKPGQFLHLTLDDYDPSLPWPESRCFSMQSSPNEDQICITFSVKGKYTKRMAEELFVGKDIWLKLPYGDLFSRSHSLNKCVFIAGGTGITPFLSLFTDRSFSYYIDPVLYFGARTIQHNIYNNELEKAKQINPDLVIKTIYEETSGILNIEKIFNENGNNSTYFISGTPMMIKSFRQHLCSIKLDESKVRTDEWE
jgi:ferredoxin-NADP reductase